MSVAFNPFHAGSVTDCEGGFGTQANQLGSHNCVTFDFPLAAAAKKKTVSLLHPNPLF